MFKNLTAIIAGTLIALAAGPAFAKSNNVPATLEDIQETIDSLQDAVDDLQNLLEPKTIFVTSTTHTGDLGGLAGADQICQGLADAPGSIVPEGEYVALLSVNGVNASARLTLSSGPYVHPGRGLVAADVAALFSTRAGSPDRDLINPIFFDEQGDGHAFVSAWTGTAPSGLFLTVDCGDWTIGDSGASGRDGRVDLETHEWLFNATPKCDQPRRLYCVQL